ncbi:MAG: DUF3604 domain-containing protein [Planctomycetes bacterium]|nr:DUF3604 domain-containing protein [Planctomycetota bacterium]MCB9903034.1 DUF3604 domain-containing protein [Planctomycetota bacterium]
MNTTYTHASLRRLPFCSALCAALLAGHAAAQVNPSAEDVERNPPGRDYSPYAGRNFPNRPLWGDTHLHTNLSMDAGLFGNRLGPEDAYRFALGHEVRSSSGQTVRISRPLDFLVVADHSDGMGFFNDLTKGAPNILKDPMGKRWYEGFETGGQAAVDATLDLITNFSQGTISESMLADYSPGSKTYESLWNSVVDIAEQYNDPGHFTAFIGFEWTSLIKGNNMHRVVIFRDDADRAKQVVPMVQTPPFGSPDPRDLWAYLEDYEQKTGGDIFAIAHNGNLSNGIMFRLSDQWNGREFDLDYVTQRAKWEPLYEATQIKGDGEAHPVLSPNDEFADYETWDAGNLDLSEAKTDEMLAGEYAREALKRGLLIEDRFGVNPYKFGMIGSTDSHTSLATTEESNFWGKHSGSEPSPDRWKHPFSKTEHGELAGWQPTASGLAAVWAEENTRESIFDAMERKETYATTGTRIGVRFFGGWEFGAEDLSTRVPAAAGYGKGVPMGSDLPPRANDVAPNFLVYALKDPIGANLDRIQIVKGWVDADGDAQEHVYDVAWSGDRKPDAQGKVPAVGDTVDTKTATWTNTIGASELATVWTDPDFDPALDAFYYARVLEIPTPRWVLYDAVFYGFELPPDIPVKGQERAYTSPIWYSAAN